MKITLLTGKTFDLSKHLDFKIKVVHSKRAKRLTLRIDEMERLPILTVPQRCSEKKALAFVEEHQDWITNMLAKLPKSKKIKDGSQISFFGQILTINHHPELRAGTYIEGTKIIVCGNKEFIHRRVIDFLKKQAHERLLELSKAKARLINCEINSVCIKETKSRWGSCSSKNNINYNWRITLAPAYVINYLISHEVSHLAHQDHSKEFWACVERLCPDYKDGRKWLKIKGKELYLYI